MDTLLKPDIIPYTPGADAPPPNTSQPLKLWKDPSATSLDPSHLLTYNVFPTDGTAVVILTIPADVAANFNVPGHSSYPAPTPPTTVAYYSDANGGNHGFLDASSLCLKSTAQALLEELGWDTLPLVDTLAGGQIIYNTERGRAWGFSQGPDNYLAAGLLAAKNSNGVGAPGHWDLAARPIQWISDVPPPPAPAPGPAVPFPLRDLAPGEEYHVVSSLMGAYVQIVVGLSQPTPFLISDQLRLQRVEQKLDQLLAKVSK